MPRHGAADDLVAIDGLAFEAVLRDETLEVTVTAADPDAIAELQRRAALAVDPGSVIAHGVRAGVTAAPGYRCLHPDNPRIRIDAPVTPSVTQAGAMLAPWGRMQIPDHDEQTWAIVLAGGDGTRLSAMTEALHGCPVPKQFATVAGDRSMLQATLDRIAPIVPARRTVIVVGRAHLPWVRAQLADHAATTLVQPASLGTATAVLYALTWIRLQDPSAHVLVFPSDHHVGNVPPFLDSVRTAARASVELERLALLGVVPDVPDPDYGWIVAGPAVQPACCTLESFVEKPGAEAAQRLHACGGLWNTFVLAAPASLLAAVARAHLPDHAARFDALDRFSFAPGAPDLEDVYANLEPADFSMRVLQRAGDLLVVPMHGADWSDWGTPDRVLASLRPRAASRLRRRLKTAAPVARTAKG